MHTDREKLADLYRSQLEDAGPFMRVVLKEAIRKLGETSIKRERIENWVVKLEKSWRTI